MLASLRSVGIALQDAAIEASELGDHLATIFSIAREDAALRDLKQVPLIVVDGVKAGCRGRSGVHIEPLLVGLGIPARLLRRDLLQLLQALTDLRRRLIRPLHRLCCCLEDEGLGLRVSRSD